MSDAQYNRYITLHTFASDWRKYNVKNNMLNKEDFRKQMQIKEYIMINCTNEQNSRNITIILFTENSQYTSKATLLKKILTQINDSGDVILVSHATLGTHFIRVIHSFKHLKIKAYLHQNFNIIVPNGPLCYPHRVLSKEEVRNLLNNEMFVHLSNLPKILVEDVQCIWIGAEVGDVVEIKMHSDISGYCIQYRVVISKSGRLISLKESKQDDDIIVPEDNEEELIQEIRENIKDEKANEDYNYDSTEETDEKIETDVE